MYHAWYSAQQERELNLSGSTANIYLTESGEEVKITEISSYDKSETFWSDLEYLGIVKKWVRFCDPVIDKTEFEQAKRHRNTRLEFLRSR
jgi:hypothetical protein